MDGRFPADLVDSLGVGADYGEISGLDLGTAPGSGPARQAEGKRESAYQYEAKRPGRIQIEPTP